MTTCVFDFFCEVDRKMSTCDSPSVLCQGSDTSTRKHSNNSRDIVFSCLSVCGKSGRALGSIDLVCVDGLLFLKDDVLDADPSRSRGFRRFLPSGSWLMLQGSESKSSLPDVKPIS